VAHNSLNTFPGQSRIVKSLNHYTVETVLPLQRLNASTIQRFNGLTVQHFNASTLQRT